MPPEMIQLLENPYLLIAILLVGVFVGMTIERSLSDIRRQTWRKRNSWRWKRKRRAAVAPVRASHGSLSSSWRFRNNLMLPISCELLWQLTSRFNRSSIRAKRVFFGSSIAS